MTIAVRISDTEQIAFMVSRAVSAEDIGGDLHALLNGQFVDLAKDKIELSFSAFDRAVIIYLRLFEYDLLFLRDRDDMKEIAGVKIERTANLIRYVDQSLAAEKSV